MKHVFKSQKEELAKIIQTFPSEVVMKGECPVWNSNSWTYPKDLISHLNLRCLNYVNTILYLVSNNSTRNVTFAIIHFWQLRHSDCSQYFIYIKRNWTLLLRTAFFWVTGITQQLVLNDIDNIFRMEPIFVLKRR